MMRPNPQATRPSRRARDPRLALPCLLFASAFFGGAPSEAAQTSSAVSEEAIIAELPMLSTEDSPLVYIDLAPPGEPPIRAILDTGIGTSIAGPSALKAFGGERQPGDTIAYSRDTILGRPLVVYEGLLKNPSTRTSPYIRLGSRDLTAWIVELDFMTRQVRFLDPAKVTVPEANPSADEAVLPMERYGSRLFTHIDLNGEPTRVAVDTSVLVPIWLSPHNLKKAGISPRTLPVLRWPGPSGTALRLFETDQIRLGSMPLGVLPVIVSKTGHFDAFGLNNNLIGLDLLSQFRVRIDVTGKRLWLQAAPQGAIQFGGLPYSLTRRSGAFMTNFGRRFVVYGVLPDSPAEQLGLLPGDSIDIERTGSPRTSQQLNAIRKQAPLIVTRKPGGTGAEEAVQLPASADSGS